MMVAVITGASSGIGRATALKFARKGYNVLLAARFGAGLEEVAQECEQIGIKALVMPTDVSREEEVFALAARAVQNFGQLDVWVNNAAVTVFGQLEEIPTQDIRRLLDINVLGYIYGAQAAIRQFRAQGHGTLINVSSMVAISGQPYSVPYSVSKSAVRGMSLSLSQELADEKKINVCCVLPAVIDTPIFQHAANYMGQRVQPPRPIIGAEKVAKAIYKLAKQPQDEIMVGNMGRMMRAQRLVMPVRMFDKMMQKKIQKEHFKKEETSGNSQGNLYEPMTNWNQVNGGWRAEAPKKEKDRTIINAMAYTSLALVGIIVGTVVLQKK